MAQDLGFRASIDLRCRVKGWGRSLEPLGFGRFAGVFLGVRVFIRWTPHPVIVTVRDNRDYIRSFYILTIPLLQDGGSS